MWEHGARSGIPRRSGNCYVFDAADRLTSATVAEGTNTFAETYLYDGCGALTNRQSVASDQQFEYDCAGRLTYSQQSAAYSLALTYDALGNRLTTYAANATRIWITDHADPRKRPLMETDANGEPVRYFIWGGGFLLAVVEADGTMRYCHSDDQGGIVALTDSNGTVTDQYCYGPYGTDWGHSGTNSIPFRWLGSHGVFNVGGSPLYLTRYRAYDANMCRFLSSDPLGLGGGPNLYAYCMGSPLAYIDPLGLGGETASIMDRPLGVIRAIGGGLETAAGVGLGVATSWTGVGAIGGGLVAAHGLDQVQAGIRQAISGGQIDSVTSSGLQMAGISRTSANLTDGLISIVGSFGAGTATASIRAAQIAAVDPLAKGLATSQILTRYETGSQALNSVDFVALGGKATPATTPLARAAMIGQGVNAANQPYQLTTTFGQATWQSGRLALGLEGTSGMGLTPLGYFGAGVGGGVGGFGNVINTVLK